MKTAAILTVTTRNWRFLLQRDNKIYVLDRQWPQTDQIHPVLSIQQPAMSRTGNLLLRYNALFHHRVVKKNS